MQKQWKRLKFYGKRIFDERSWKHTRQYNQNKPIQSWRDTISNRNKFRYRIPLALYRFMLVVLSKCFQLLSSKISRFHKTLNAFTIFASGRGSSQFFASAFSSSKVIRFQFLSLKCFRFYKINRFQSPLPQAWHEVSDIKSWQS